MVIELQKTGMSVVSDVPWGTHFCHFYETKQDLLDILIPYFKAGLESKDFCLWVVSNSGLITVEEAKAALEQAVPDFDRHLSDGNIEILNGDDWYLEENVFKLERVTSAWDAKLKQALALGYNGMRASGDTFWLGEKDWKDFGAYEKHINDSTTDRRMTLLCTYPLAKSGAAEILDVVQAHQFAIARRQGEWEVIQTQELIQAKAELKRLNEELRRVIDRTRKPPVILRYVAAVLSVTAALIITLWMRMELGQPSTPIVAVFLCAVMFSAWFGGIGPGLLAIALSLLAIDYYFVTPLYSLAVDIKEIPSLIVFALSALFIGSLSAAQRSTAESLRHARDVLDGTVQELKRTNQTLREEITEKKQAQQRLAERARISMLGDDVGRSLTQSASLSEALNRCAEALVRHLDAAFARIWTVDETGQILELQASAGIYTNLNGTYSRIPVGHLKVGRIARARLPHLTNDLQNDPEADHPEWVKREGFVAFTGYPLIVEKQLLGVVGLFARHPFSDLVLEALASNTAGIALGIKRAQAEQALRRSEALLRGTFERSAVGITLTDLSGRFVKTNNAYQKLLGYSETELEAITFQALIHPDELGRIQELLKELMSGHREQYQLEKRCITKNGDVIWVRSSISLIRDQQKKPQYIIAIVEDITEHKHAEEKLKQSESQLAEAQRLAHVGSWSLELSSNTVTWSDELYRIFGVQPSEFDHRYEAVVGTTHPEDRDWLRNVIEDSRKTHEPFSAYYRIILPTGEVRVLHAHGAVVTDEHGNAIRIHGTAQDMTERKRAEEALKESQRRLEAAQRIAHVGHWERDLRTGEITWSDEIYRILGLEQQVSPPTAWEHIIHPEDRERISLAIEEAQRGIGRYDVEYRIVRPDGEVRFVHSQGDIIRDEQGRARRAFGIAQDITERKRAEERLRATTEQLRALSARIHLAKEEEGTRIAREIHDELGAALTSLRWDLESFDKVISESGDQPQLKVLRERIEAMLRLTETTIGSVRRISSELRPSVLDDLGLVEAIEWQAEQFQARTGIICRCDCSLENLNLSREQSTAIFRILQEALTNILRHAQATSVNIKMTAEAGEFVLTIIDNGRGITENEKSGSQSLGLLGMQERAHLIGGKLSITGVEGEGTVITVRVPTSG